MNHFPFVISLVLLLCTLSFVNPVKAQVFLSQPARVPIEAQDWQTKDVRAIDIDQDDDLDIIVANEFDQNAILLNDGNGIFSVGNQGIPPSIIHDSEDIVLADFNGDGFLDIIFISEDDFENEYYWNTGSGSFVSSPNVLPFTSSNAAAAVDITNDGRPDLILGNNDQNMILVNDGFGNLLVDTDRLPLLTEKTHDIKMLDIEGDGDMDMFVANEGTNRLMINDGAGFFVDASAARLPSGLNLDTRKAVIADANGDGFPDIFLCNVEFSLATNPQDRLFLNDGAGYFTDATERLPSKNNQTLDAVFIDLDEDGDLDLITANVFGNPVNILLNIDNQFHPVSAAAINPLGAVEAFGIVPGDFDKDGYVDFYIANAAGKDLVLIRDASVQLVSTQEVSDFATQIELFPNPIQSSFSLKWEPEFVNEKTVFQIFNGQGQRIQQLFPQQKTDKRYTFTLPENFPAGCYYLQIQNGTQIGVKRFLKIP
ncbi:MAG: T9SS type A sorting domain-containing protein [Saprospiraceae bacterium]